MLFFQLRTNGVPLAQEVLMGDTTVIIPDYLMRRATTPATGAQLARRITPSPRCIIQVHAVVAHASRGWMSGKGASGSPPGAE